MLVKQIEQESNTAMEKLDEYESRVKEVVMTKEYTNESENLEKEIRMRKEDLAKWKNELNLPKVDVERYNDIEDECANKLVELSKQAQKFGSDFHLKDFNQLELLDFDFLVESIHFESMFAKHSKINAYAVFFFITF